MLTNQLCDNHVLNSRWFSEFEVMKLMIYYHFKYKRLSLILSVVVNHRISMRHKHLVLKNHTMNLPSSCRQDFF
ncbi:unnamed protein product [Periconia digitata]|uniref:Uncharacterized protein n=1 Tax=Periconia digitata TaxID=1303443 RepID=A0A9W4UC14_9PLEO|nr:unnamed protein product [Periconia digitata]